MSTPAFELIILDNGDIGLQRAGVNETLVQVRFSAKIKKFNLIGIPAQVVIGNKTEGDNFEFINIGKESINLSSNQIIEFINQSKKN